MVELWDLKRWSSDETQMRWHDFRRWAATSHGYEFGWSVTGAEWRAVWGGLSPIRYARTGSGSGHPVVYGPVQRRRFAAWLRCRNLVSNRDLNDWLTEAEQHDDGWLFNSGEGIRWVKEIEPIALKLVQQGVIAVRCGP